MSLDGDDAFAGNIFESVVRAHRETGADVVQFEMKLSGVRLFNYRTAPRDVFDNEELRKEVIKGHVMWNACLVSIERGLCVRVFANLSVQFNRSLSSAEDRLQMYVTFYFARKMVILHQWGYSYYRMQKNWSREKWDRSRREDREVSNFLRVFYNCKNMDLG
jgi:hypothetical protein